MAGDWIKIEKATPDKPEILRMARALGLDSDSVFGKWVRVWIWFDSNSVDGRVDGLVDGDVDRLICTPGFAAAAVAVGWICVDASSKFISLPNFDHHNGETAKTRALKTKRQGKWRATPSTEASTEASTNAPPEKRREDSNTPPNPQRGNRKKTPIEEFNSDRRKREYFKPIGTDRSEQAVKAWVASHNPELIPRDKTTVSLLVEGDGKHLDELDFYRFAARISEGMLS